MGSLLDGVVVQPIIETGLMGLIGGIGLMGWFVALA